MAFAFLIPIAKIALKAVLGEVLGAEKKFGAGKGSEKLDAATTGVQDVLGGSFDLNKVIGAIDDIVSLVNAVVEVLSSLGLLDDKPGLSVDYARLIPAVKAVFSALAELADALSNTEPAV